MLPGPTSARLLLVGREGVVGGGVGLGSIVSGGGVAGGGFAVAVVTVDVEAAGAAALAVSGGAGLLSVHDDEGASVAACARDFTT